MKRILIFIILGLACSLSFYAENYEVKIEVPQSVCTSDTLWVKCTIANNSNKSIKVVDSFLYGAKYWGACGFYFSLYNSRNTYISTLRLGQPIIPFKLIKIKKHSKYIAIIPLLFDNLCNEILGSRVDVEPGFYNLKMQLTLFRPQDIEIKSNIPTIEIKNS